MSARETVLDYYEALRRGEPLYPYFVERDDVVKVAISERLVGYGAVAEALREQTRTTEDWTVESGDLLVAEHGDVAWFDDAVRLSWTLVRRDERVEHDTRWSGVLQRRAAVGRSGEDSDRGVVDDEGSGYHESSVGDEGIKDDEASADDEGGEGDGASEGDAEWLFAGMHVSTAGDVVG